jgi:hypothetical protein
MVVGGGLDALSLREIAYVGHFAPSLENSPLGCFPFTGFKSLTCEGNKIGSLSAP